MSRAPSVIPAHLLGTAPVPKATCRVKGCRRKTATGWYALDGSKYDGAPRPRDHGFCWHHVLDAPESYLRRWMAAKSQEVLWRLWQTIEDDWIIGGG